MPQLELFHAVGKDERDMRRILRPLEEAAEAEGFGPYHAIDRTLGPTDHAHELLAFASDKGLNAEAWSTMFRAHFGEARKLWTIDEVVDFAAEIGLDAAEARRALESRSYRSRVEEEQRNAQRLGAAGTPFIVIDDTYGIAGGRDTAALLAALRQVWDESHPAPAIISFDDVEGDSCGPDGCTVSGASAESPAGP